MSAVLVGFVLVSKLNAFGLSECGEAVVELANHSFESVVGFDRPVALADDAVEPPTFDALPPDNALLPDSCCESLKNFYNLLTQMLKSTQILFCLYVFLKITISFSSGGGIFFLSHKIFICM